MRRHFQIHDSRITRREDEPHHILEDAEYAFICQVVKDLLGWGSVYNVIKLERIF